MHTIVTMASIAIISDVTNILPYLENWFSIIVQQFEQTTQLLGQFTTEISPYFGHIVTFSFNPGEQFINYEDAGTMLRQYSNMLKDYHNLPSSKDTEIKVEQFWTQFKNLSKQLNSCFDDSEEFFTKEFEHISSDSSLSLLINLQSTR
jgi:hypothetical protein